MAETKPVSGSGDADGQPRHNIANVDALYKFAQGRGTKLSRDEFHSRMDDPARAEKYLDKLIANNAIQEADKAGFISKIYEGVDFGMPASPLVYANAPEAEKPQFPGVPEVKKPERENPQRGADSVRTDIGGGNKPAFSPYGGLIPKTKNERAAKAAELFSGQDGRRTPLENMLFWQDQYNAAVEEADRRRKDWIPASDAEAVANFNKAARGEKESLEETLVRKKRLADAGAEADRYTAEFVEPSKREYKKALGDYYNARRDDLYLQVRAAEEKVMESLAGYGVKGLPHVLPYDEEREHDPTFQKRIREAARDMSHEEAKAIYENRGHYKTAYNNYAKGQRINSLEEDASAWSRMLSGLATAFDKGKGLYTLGLSGMADAWKAKNALDRVKAGEGTEADEDYLRSIYDKGLAEGIFDGGTAYNVGQAAWGSLEFMLDMLVTGGIGGLVKKGVGTGARAVAKAVGKNAGREIAEGLAKQAAKDTFGGAMKRAGAGFADNVIGAPLSPQVYRGAAERQIGNYAQGYDENSRFAVREYDNPEGMWASLGYSGLGYILEAASEKLVGPLWEQGVKAVKPVLSRPVARVAGDKNWYRNVSAFMNGTGNALSKRWRALRDRISVEGLSGETFEEVVNEPLQRWLVAPTAQERYAMDQNGSSRWDGMYSGDWWAETVGTCALIQLGFATPQMLANGAYTADNIRLMNKYIRQIPEDMAQRLKKAALIDDADSRNEAVAAVMRGATDKQRSDAAKYLIAREGRNLGLSYRMAEVTNQGVERLYATLAPLGDAEGRLLMVQDKETGQWYVSAIPGTLSDDSRIVRPVEVQADGMVAVGRPRQVSTSSLNIEDSYYTSVDAYVNEFTKKRTAAAEAEGQAVRVEDELSSRPAVRRSDTFVVDRTFVYTDERGKTQAAGEGSTIVPLADVAEGSAPDTPVSVVITKKGGSVSKSGVIMLGELQDKIGSGEVKRRALTEEEAQTVEADKGDLTGGKPIENVENEAVNVVDGGVGADVEAQGVENNEVEPAQPLSESGTSIPQDESGRTQYETVPVDDTVRSIYDESGLSAEQAGAFVNKKLAAARSEVEKLVKKEPQIDTFDEIALYKQAHDKWQAQMDAAQSKAGYWEEVSESRKEGADPTEVGTGAELYDNQGNPIDENGELVVEPINSIEDLTDEDFENPTRNVQLPPLPENVSDAIGSDGKPVVIKKSIFEKNKDVHPEFDPKDSRSILTRALYNPDLAGLTQPKTRPYYRVVIQTGDMNAVVVLDVYENKSNTEIVGWREMNERGLEKLKRQAEREDGQLLILSPGTTSGSAAALSVLPSDLSSADKGTEVSEEKQVQLPENTVAAKWNALVADNEGDEAEALDTAMQMVANKTAELDQARKTVAKGKTEEAISEAKRAKREKISVLETELRFWKDVAGYPDKKRASEEVSAALTSRLERERKRKERQSSNPHHGLRQTEADDRLGAPLSLREYVIRKIATGRVKFLWSGSESGTGGLKEHGGAAKRQMLYTDKTRGQYPEDVAEAMWLDIMDNHPEFGQMDASDILSEIEDLAVGEQTPSEMMEEADRLHERSLRFVTDDRRAEDVPPEVGGTAAGAVTPPAETEGKESKPRFAGEVFADEEWMREGDAGEAVPFQRVQGADLSPLASDRQAKAIARQLKKLGLKGKVRIVDGVGELVKAARARLQSVFHGSPHNFEAFDFSHMGSGEGAQAYGWGGYVTEVEKIGRTYAEELAGKDDKLRENKIINDLVREHLERNSKEEALSYLQSLLNESWSDKKRLKAQIKILETGRFLKEPIRHLYHVEIPTERDGNYLRWEEPVSDGSYLMDELMSALRREMENDTEFWEKKGEDAWKENHRDPLDYWLEETGRDGFMFDENSTGKEIYERISRFLGRSDKAASEFLSSLDFVGISYPAQYQNGGRADDKRNYVIFKESDMKITDHIRYEQDASGEIAGATLPNGDVLLNRRAMRVDTPFHEFAHKLFTYAKDNRGAGRLYDAIRRYAREAPQGVKDYVSAHYPGLSEDAYLDEVFAWALSRQSAGGLEAFLKERGIGADDTASRTWYERVWDAVKSLWAEVRPRVSRLLGRDFADLSVFDAYDEMGAEETGRTLYGLLMGGKRLPYAEQVAESADVRAQSESAEAAEIERRSKAAGTWLKAPNGKPTKLSPKQWVQVRTKAFKDWFGDWEKAARIEKLRDSKPIEITGNEIVASDDLNQYKKNALNYGKTLRGEYENKDTGTRVSVNRQSIKEILHHDGRDAAHVQSVAAIPAIIENGIYIDTIKNEDTKKNPDIKEYQYYVAGLKIGDIDYTVKSVIGVDRNGNRYYDHALTQIEKGNLLNELARITSPASQKANPLSDIKDKRLLSILQTDSSRVVDENGEPLVVYHGTGSEFTVFDKKKIRRRSDGIRGFYFAPPVRKMSVAGYYGAEGNAKGFYLSIKTPLVVPTDVKIDKNDIQGYDGIVRLSAADFANDFYNYETHEVETETLKKGDLVEIVAFSPTQIKSATDNVGTFDAGNADIRYQKKFFDGLDADGVYDGLLELSDYNYGGASRLIGDLEIYYGGSLESASGGAKRAMERGLVPFSGTKYSGLDLEYHHMAFVDENGERNVEAVPFTTPEALRESRGDLRFRFAGDMFGTEGMPNRYRIAQPVEGQKNLVAVHNLSEEKMRQAFELGGFPMPSIAITKADIGHTAFGDISLVFDKESINPTDSRNKVYGEDAWTPTFPEIGLKIDENVADAARKKLYGILGDLYRDLRASLYLDADNLSETVNRYDGDMAAAFADKDFMKYAYRKEKGLEQNPEREDKDYRKWIADMFQGIVQKRGIRNNKDWFTPSGIARKWEDLYDNITLDNVVNAMQKQNAKGGQGLFGANIFGSAQEEYKSIEDIRSAAKQRLRNISEEETIEARKEIEDRLSAIKIPGAGDKVSDIFDMIENIQEAVSKSHTAKGIYKYLHDFYPDMTMDIAKEIEDIVKDIQKMSARYFEAKPYRAVDFSEVKLAVVPDNIDKSIIERLNDLHIPVETYEHGNDEQRVQILNEATENLDLRFRKGNNGGVSASADTSLQAKLQAALDAGASLGVPIVVEETPAGGRRAKDDALGWYDTRTGAVHVTPGNHADAEDVKRTVLHEAVGHMGMRRLLEGKHPGTYDAFLDRVHASMPAEASAYFLDYARRSQAGRALSEAELSRIAADEYVAALAEVGGDPNVWQKVVAEVRNLLRALGFDLELSEADIRALLYESKHNLESAAYYAERELMRREQKEYRDEASLSNRLTEDEREMADDGGIEETNGRFNEQLASLTEENVDDTILSLGSPSDVLLAAGVADKPMRLYGNKIMAKIKKHGYPIAALLDLPRAVANPIAVFNNYGRSDNRSILTELKTAQGNILVAVTIGKGGADVDFNVVSSVFGKDKEKVAAWINKGYATYIDKKKALDYISVPAPIAGAQYGQGLSDATKVIESFENPKLDENASVLYRMRRAGTSRDGRLGVISIDADNNGRYGRWTRQGLFKCASDVARYFLDDSLPLRHTMTHIKRSVGGVVTDATDLWRQKTMMVSRARYRINEYNRKIGEPLMKTVRGIYRATKDMAADYLGDLSKDGKAGKAYYIDLYLMAKHMPERNAWMAENRDSGKSDYAGADGFKDRTGMTPVEYAARFEKMISDAGLDGDLAEMWRLINASTDFSLRQRVDDGLMDKDFYESIKARGWRYYVPLRSWDERNSQSPEYTDMEYPLQVDAMNDTFTNNVKRAEGRSSLADNPLAYIFRDAETSITLGETNRFRQAVAKLRDDNSKLTYIFGSPKFLEGKETMLEEQSHFVTYYENGKRKQVGFVNPMLAAAIRGDRERKRRNWMKPMQWWTRIQSALNTSLNPAFALTNAARDIQFGIFSRFVESANPIEGIAASAAFIYELIRNLPAAVAASTKEGTLQGSFFRPDIIEAWRKNGGETGWHALNDLRETKDKLYKGITSGKMENGAKAVLTAIPATFRVLTEVSENAVRLAAFSDAKRRGMSDQGAASYSKEITTNFNRHSRIAQDLGPLYMFLNAQTQGIYRFLSLAKENQGNFAVASIGMVAAGLLMSMSAALNSGDDDDEKGDYLDRSEFLRFNNFISGNFLLPVAHNARMFYGIGAAVGDYIMGHSNENELAFNLMQVTGRELLPSILNATDWFVYDPASRGLKFDPKALAAGIAPSAIVPIVEGMTNRNFMGSPIYQEQSVFVPYAPRVARSRKDVNPFLLNLTEAVAAMDGYNPEVNKKTGFRADKKRTIRGAYDWNASAVEHAITSLAGGTGKFLNDIDKLVRKWRTEGEDIEASDIPILKSFVRPINEDAGLYNTYNRLSGQKDLWEKALKERLENISSSVISGEGRRMSVNDYMELQRSSSAGGLKEFAKYEEAVKRLLDVQKKYGETSDEVREMRKKIMRMANSIENRAIREQNAAQADRKEVFENIRKDRRGVIEDVWDLLLRRGRAGKERAAE